MVGSTATGRHEEKAQEKALAASADGTVHQEQLRVSVLSDHLYAHQRGTVCFARYSVPKLQWICHNGASLW